MVPELSEVPPTRRVPSSPPAAPRNSATLVGSVSARLGSVLTYFNPYFKLKTDERGGAANPDGMGIETPAPAPDPVAVEAGNNEESLNGRRSGVSR